MQNLSHLLSDSQRRLLEIVKRRGELTVEAAVRATDLAETTIRQHFEHLEETGLLRRRSEARGRGRPTLVFELTAAAEQLYPSGDSEMLAGLLGFLTREGYHAALDDFFREFWEERRRRLEARLEEAEPADFAERLEVLREFLDDQGFMPQVEVDEQTGAVEICECNCPLAGAVQVTRLPCRLEAEFLEKVVGQTLSRVEYMPDGHATCSYRFRRGDTADEEGSDGAGPG